MHNKDIETLLNSYINRTISDADYQRLKVIMISTDPEQIDESLQALWSEYHNDTEINKEAYNEILYNINLITKKESRFPVKLYAKRVMVGIAAAMIPLLLITSSFLYTQNREMARHSEKMFCFESNNSKTSSVSLPDGTNVTMNSKTTVKYPSLFGYNSREVEIIGEAFFDVAKDPSVAFVVKSEDVEISVLGTKFNVNTHKNDNLLEVALVEGSVSIKIASELNKRIILEPYQKFSYNKTDKSWEVKNSNLKQELSWTKGKLIFTSQSIESVLFQLEELYQVEINIIGDTPTDTFTGSFHESSVESVLNSLKMIYDLTYRQQGNKIYIKFR